ncbi:MAG: replicative DNA helicase, partial [Bacteroidales bacterium]|nr:replicative DNA helicase [Bacteroidales bacterium]
EQDADMVLFIHRPALLGLSEDGIDRAELIIAKNRAGEMGIIPLRFNGDQVTFKEDNMSLADYAAAVPVQSAMNSYDITPRPSEGYSPFDHLESGDL